MHTIGFSTGALSRGDFKAGIELARQHDLLAIELSALRESELPRLVEEFPNLHLAGFQFVSIHAPSRLERLSEVEVVDLLSALPEHHPIVVHPDVINDPEPWLRLGSRLVLENMDQRKPCGRTAAEIAMMFEPFPDAGFCFDIAHARQIDPTMSLTVAVLNRWSDRVVQIHMSELTTDSRHRSMTSGARWAFTKIAGLLPEVPIILESMVEPGEIKREVRVAQEILQAGVSSTRAAVASERQAASGSDKETLAV